MSVLALILTILPNNVVLANSSPVEIWVPQVNASNTGMAKGLEKQGNIQFVSDNGAKCPT